MVAAYVHRVTPEHIQSEHGEYRVIKRGKCTNPMVNYSYDILANEDVIGHKTGK